MATIAASGALLLAACGGDGGARGGQSSLSGPVMVDGSSTVAPLSSAAGELFQRENPGVIVTVGTSGTGGGFEKLCNAETDISGASRPIEDDEKASCAARNIAFSELQIANDALVVVVNKENTWASCLTTEQLKTIWGPGSQVTSWNEVDPSFPDVPLKLFGPGSDSGTFDYFTDKVNGEEGTSRVDYNPSEDDNRIVQGVQASKGALGYFGFSYFEENQDKLRAVQINSGSGCVAPSPQTAQDGTYKPLSRPLFIYTSDAALRKPQVVAFIEFYLKQIDEIQKSRFIPMTDAQKQKSQQEVQQLKRKAGV